MRKFSSIPPILIAAAAAALLTGCASASREDPKTGALTATEQWTASVSVDAHPQELLLAVHPGGLSANQAEHLQGFVQDWVFAEGGAITVRAPRPRGAAGPVIADRMAIEARDFMVAQGAPAYRVEIVAYDSTGAADAPLVIAYDRFTVETPECGGDIENLSRTMDNRPSRNFGCAVTANMAAQLANPEDLLRPRGLDSADAGRRSVVLDKYRRGEKTASERDDQATGAVSKAVN